MLVILLIAWQFVHEGRHLHVASSLPSALYFHYTNDVGYQISL